MHGQNDEKEEFEYWLQRSIDEGIDYLYSPDDSLRYIEDTLNVIFLEEPIKIG